MLAITSLDPKDDGSNESKIGWTETQYTKNPWTHTKKNVKLKPVLKLYIL